jgi:hypothetical protein
LGYAGKFRWSGENIWIEKEIGEGFNTAGTEREERRAQRKKEGGLKPPLQGCRGLLGHRD